MVPPLVYQLVDIYDEGTDYEFCVYGDNGEEIKIVITNVGGGNREMVVQKLSN